MSGASPGNTLESGVLHLDMRWEKLNIFVTRNNNWRRCQQICAIHGYVEVYMDGGRDRERITKSVTANLNVGRYADADADAAAGIGLSLV
jgi:hypothetical protein